MALSNTVAEFVTLLGGVLGCLAQLIGLQNFIIVLISLAFLSSLTSWSLPEVQNLAKTSS